MNTFLQFKELNEDDKIYIKYHLMQNVEDDDFCFHGKYETLKKKEYEWQLYAFKQNLFLCTFYKEGIPISTNINISSEAAYELAFDGVFEFERIEEEI